MMDQVQAIVRGRKEKLEQMQTTIIDIFLYPCRLTRKGKLQRSSASWIRRRR